MTSTAQRESTASDAPVPLPPRRRGWLRWGAAGLVVLLVPPLISLIGALTYPGEAPLSVKALEWVRDHGGGGAVDAAENWWYSRQRPAVGTTPQDGLGPLRTGGAPALHGLATAHQPEVQLPRVRLMAGAHLAGEGQWRVASADRHGIGLLYRTIVRADAHYPSVVAAAALFPRGLVRFHLQPGTREPSPGLVSAAQSQVPAPQRRHLVAVFNAGWKLKDSEGGWFAAGREVGTLRPGAATLVIDAAGRASVTRWSASSATTGLTAVRQNLHLVVSGGHPVAGLSSNRGQLWGDSKNQFQYTWRSAVGTDRAGDLVYVAGRSLTLQTLVDAMVRVGIVTGMEMDMHSHMVGLLSFAAPGRTTAGGTRLLQDMPIPTNRYLVPDQRDYLSVTAR